MAVNSYQGINSVKGVNSFGGGNSFAAPLDSRNIQSSGIADSGIRGLLADQFKSPNSYTKLGVAPIGGLKSVMNQYSELSPDDIKRFSVADEFNALKPSATTDPGNAIYNRDAVANAIAAYNARQRSVQNAATAQPGQGTRTAQADSWTAPSSWAQSLADMDYNDKSAQYSNAHAPMYQGYREGVGPDEAMSPFFAPTYSREEVGVQPLEYYQNQANEQGLMMRRAGFLPDNSQGDYLATQGWRFNPGYGSMQIDGVNAPYEEGAGTWIKERPDKGYHGQGEDYVMYSPTRGYSTSNYYKTAPQPHGLAGFMGSAGGMFLSSLLGMGLGPLAEGLGGLFSGGEALGGIGSIPGSAVFGSSAAGLSPGALSAMGSGAGMALSSIPTTTGGLFGNGGVFGSGIDLGSSLGNNLTESFLKNTAQGAITNGGDLKKAGMSGLTGLIGQGLGQGLGLDPWIAKGISGGIGAALNGGNVGMGALGGAASGALGSLARDYLPNDLSTKMLTSGASGALSALLNHGNVGSGILGGMTSSVGVPPALTKLALAPRKRKIT
jgi:hypothetical protein